MTIALRKPSWLTVSSVVDLLDPAKTAIPHKVEDGLIKITLPRLDLLKVGWIANTPSA